MKLNQKNLIQMSQTNKVIGLQVTMSCYPAQTNEQKLCNTVMNDIIGQNN